MLGSIGKVVPEAACGGSGNVASGALLYCPRGVCLHRRHDAGGNALQLEASRDKWTGVSPASLRLFVNLACGRALVQAAVVGKQEVKRLSNEINAQRHRSNTCPR